MAKTRSQTKNITIKKEEEEEDCKSTLLLNGVSNTRNNNRITKRTIPKNRKSRLPAQDIKVEEDTDTKSLLQSSSKSSKLPKRQHISQEQIDQLIDAIVNDKMSIRKAASAVKVSPATAYDYYNIYKSDPEKKIPLAGIRFVYPHRVHMQEHIENLIRYIKKDKMSVPKASAKANMSYDSGRKYYNRYLQDPNHAIPIPPSRQYYTQDQKNECIGYIINDKMSIIAASKKAKISANAGHSYYHNYFEHQNTSVPKPSHISTHKRYTQEQIKEAISYIVDDKMTVAAASRKANISETSASNYYHQYLKDHNMEIPVSKFTKRYSQDEINKITGYIVDDKMSIKAASKKVNMCRETASYHYHQYLKCHNMEIPVSKLKKRYTQEQINKLIGYIIDDKMTIAAASRKVNMCQVSARPHYHQYLKNHNMEIPVSKRSKRYKQDEINQFIGYIVDDKMSIKAASKKANMHAITGTKYYRQYLNDTKRDSST